MKTKKPTVVFRQHLPVLALGALCTVSAFTIGLRTNGNVAATLSSAADEISIAGDMDGDGTVAINDAVVILEIVQGYREATQIQLKSDPDGDGRLTADDALRILLTL